MLIDSAKRADVADQPLDDRQHLTRQPLGAVEGRHHTVEPGGAARRPRERRLFAALPEKGDAAARSPRPRAFERRRAAQVACGRPERPRRRAEPARLGLLTQDLDPASDNDRRDAVQAASWRSSSSGHETGVGAPSSACGACARPAPWTGPTMSAAAQRDAGRHRTGGLSRRRVVQPGGRSGEVFRLASPMATSQRVAQPAEAAAVQERARDQLRQALLAGSTGPPASCRCRRRRRSAAPAARAFRMSYQFSRCPRDVPGLRWSPGCG